MEELTDFVISQTTIHVDQPDIGTTHYAFSVKKVNAKFWSTTARLLHIDLKRKDVFITYKTNANSKSDDPIEEKKPASSSSTTIIHHSSTGNDSQQPSNSSENEYQRVSSEGTTNSNAVTKSVISTTQQVTRTSLKDEPVAKLVDLFRDQAIHDYKQFWYLNV